MKILGLILLILGIINGFRSCANEPPPLASHSYQMGWRLGGVVGTVAFIGAGIWLLVRDGVRTQPRAPSTRPRSYPVRQPLPTAPPPPGPVDVKIRCHCGQSYAFNVLPVSGRMPGPVTCPECGADGTEAANASLLRAAAARAKSPPWPTRMVRPRARLHPAVIAAIVVIALIPVLMLASFLRFRSRLGRTADRPPKTWAAAPHNSRGAWAPVPPHVTAVEVFWGNRWYPATIVRREGPRAFIHYEGYSSSFDEWVTPERLRPRY